jgi:Protein of unknown function (DUF4235)
MAAKNNQLAWRVMAAGAGLATAAVTKKALGSAWKKATGAPPPGSPEHPEVRLATAVAWSLLTGAVIGVVRMFVTRQAAVTWRGLTGELPPGLTAIEA